MNHFLLVDDSDNDFFLLQHGMSKSGIVAVLDRASSVEDAMEHFQRVMAHEMDLPCAMLCDIRLHDGSGCELLEWLQHQPGLKNIPVIVWSGSGLPSTARLAQLGIQDVIVKPSNPADFIRIAATLQRLCDEGRSKRL